MTDPFFEKLHAAQQEHAVVEMLTLAELRALGDEKAYQAVEARALSIAEMDAKPLDACFVPDDWKLFLLELCEKRLAHPGAVIEFFVSGGIRAGKSFVMAMLFVAHWLYSKKSFCFALAETEETSKDLQQVPIEYFMPPQVMGGESGKVKQTKHQRMKFSGGAFTGGSFERYVDAIDETGRTTKGGGKVRFRFFSQNVRRYRGFSLTFAWSDESVPVDHVAAVKDRLVSRAADTRERWHIEKMHRLKVALQSWIAGGPRPHPSLLGALMHGMHGISYTPEEGWVATIRYFAQGGIKREQHMVVAPELQGKPGVRDPRVPKVLDCAVPTRCMFYLHTAANRIVNAYPELSRAYWDSDERTIRIKLYGDAEAADDRLFAAFTDRHITTWDKIPRQGTLYVVVDPGGSKPWVISWFLCDVAGRHYQLQEWPCPGWAIDGFDPGAWAVPSKGDKVNGDPGPAQKTRLAWSRAHYLRQIWEGNQRIIRQMAATGDAWQGRTLPGPLNWPANGWTLDGPFAVAERTLMDSRFAAAPTESKGQHTTVLEAMYDEENAIAFDPAAGVSLEEGDTMIMTALSTEILGLPGLMVNKECQNTLFMFSTYTLPAFRETTSAKDEACKDFRDPIAYYLLARPEYIDEKDQTGMQLGGSY
jgi:hypothetical protein